LAARWPSARNAARRAVEIKRRDQRECLFVAHGDSGTQDQRDGDPGDHQLEAEGDLHIDGHHTTEDSAIAIGQAFAKALGEARGIRRFGQALSPMDEALTRVVVDISGRPYCVWKVRLDRPRLGDLDTELIPHWFQTFAFNAGLTLHLETLYGENNHHICESCFKGLARALREAVEVDPRKASAIPSTKGTLGSSSTLQT
jgi:imidazoleglycerol-phosphate dehydratase